MSYDLRVIARRRPRMADLAGFLERHAELVGSVGEFKPGASTTIADGSGTTAEIDGPNRIETDDVPDAALGAIGRSGWLVEASVTPSSDATWPNNLAIHVARAADGVVYDPQQDAVTWPAGWRPRNRETGEQTIDQVELTWFFGRRSNAEHIPRGVLEALATSCPEALPKRYGDYEPLQQRFEGERAIDDFVTFWVSSADDWVAMLFWTTGRPCFGGTASMSSLRKYPPGHPTAVERVSLTFDGRAFARDPAFTERIVRLFTELASRLNSIYAAACVERGYGYRRGRPTGTAMSETGPMPRADLWVGLPAAPTWLAWFGRPYVEAVRPAIAAMITTETDAGMLLRLGDTPTNADELADTFPALPGRLLARRHGQPGRWTPGVRYSLVSGPPSQPAEEIPTLETGG